MSTLATTRMSSKGQVVIPEEIRLKPAHVSAAIAKVRTRGRSSRGGK